MKIKLYHPSDKLFDIVKIKYFGENFYTRNEKSISEIPRTFWYFTQRPHEFILRYKIYSYEIEIDNRELYDLRKDNKKLLDKYKSINDLLLYLKDNYLGAIYRHSANKSIVCIFQDMKPIRVIKEN